MKGKIRSSKDETRRGTTVKLSLDDFETKLAFTLGDGDISLGIRRAIVLSGLRLERSETVKSKPLEQTLDPVTLVTDQMADLAAEFKEQKDDPRRREEIALQITRLGKLYLALVAGSDTALDDR